MAVSERADEILRLLGAGLGVSQVARSVGCARQYVYQVAHRTTRNDDQTIENAMQEAARRRESAWTSGKCLKCGSRLFWGWNREFAECLTCGGLY